MTKEQRSVATFMSSAGQTIPSEPTIPSLEIRKLRAKLILEEALETINDGLGLQVLLMTGLPEGEMLVDMGGVSLIETGPGDLVELADGLADLAYVQLGTACAAGIDLEPVFEEVDKSNQSKFIDGYVDENGKFMKGKSFVPPNIKNVLDKQKNETK